ncbi:arginyltransferase [Sansalvadorimonas verongulae]|uniref:arginyltransferase n=1 Tax=Sansalvadorimonas verongulae TaxID=2172824 RepID=UPI0012BCCC27|nr:arginyltransferase [Sansalvadorimonas verongulae]MTI14405.1 arginyltransferase [Sansalvadorimonas verongulae]
MKNEHQIALYETDVHPCSYLSGKEASTQFLDPRFQVDASTAERLAELGFRRSGDHTYRPNCPDCSACIPLRVRVDEFEPNRTQRKILNRNAGVSVTLKLPTTNLEYYRLYRRYISERHRDGDMFPPSAKQFSEFLGIDSGYTHFWIFREHGKLLGVTVTDHFSQSLSLVYSFFRTDAGYGRRSLGIYFVLRQILAAKQAGFPYLYLGYLIRECRKMSYKTSFLPAEQFVDQQWRLIV